MFGMKAPSALSPAKSILKRPNSRE
jgi:hypothetical protein